MEHNNETIQFLQYLYDFGPMKHRNLAEDLGLSMQAVQAKINYCRTQCLIQGVREGIERPYVYSVTEQGKRRLRLESGQPVPPRTIAYKPWAPLRELEWPSVRAGADDFLQHPRRGYA